eukprot:TRINITY_DN78361_c0_g1_i1.p1 TRINITY_DN78361_c0_g1~~TRINITY_DN78361_c0_g1_i1.p1  ORF type:complete len:153 (-),score=20.94 TRINITY_DN78361_c0_g1_i1:29-487(-)
MQATWAAIGAVLLVGFLIILCTACVYFTQVYVLCPGWGPVRHFDCEAGLPVKVGSFRPAENILPVEPELTKAYGTLGKPTWGSIQAPWERSEKQLHPIYGEIIVRPGFCDTQHLRAESSWWARDEPYYLDKIHTQLQPLVINDTFDTTRPMI